MNPFYRLSLLCWLFLKHLPPMSAGRLLMPLVFLVSWTFLRMMQVSEAVAFVGAALLAQTAQIWMVLPITVHRQRRQFGSARKGVNAALGLILVLMGLQLLWLEPWLSQRILSIVCLVFAAVMAWGVWGDKDIRDRFAPVLPGSDVPLAFRLHLLKLRVVTALLVVAVNESLLAAALPLGTRVAVLSLLPIVLFYFFEIALRVSAPSLHGGDE